MEEIAEAHGISKQRLGFYMKTHGYTFPKLPKHGFTNPDCREKDRFLALMKESTGYSELGKKLNIPWQSAKVWAKYHNVGYSNFIPRKGKDSPFWTGGEYINYQGYRFVHADSKNYSEINPGNKNRYIPEHKYFVELVFLNKKQLPVSYCVHHLDEDKTNNDMGNLVILNYSQHRKCHDLITQIRKKELPEPQLFFALKRVKNLAKIYHSVNLVNIRIYYYLKEFDICVTNSVGFSDIEGFHLLDAEVDHIGRYKAPDKIVIEKV